uniref:Uncharacterized protein n=1 Tax=Meloidogyne javanica TaxID=6303 RepID=A0A915MR65_MELJA
MRLTCLTGRSLVFNLVEDSNYYSTLYYYRRVCTADKYLLLIEENEYNIPPIPIECDEAIYENQIENLYFITIQNPEENSPMISALSTDIENTRKNQQIKEIQKQIEQKHFEGANCTKNTNEKLFDKLINDAQKHYIYKTESFVKDGVIDNEGIKRIDKYLEDIKLDNEYLEKIEAKSISLINELTK